MRIRKRVWKTHVYTSDLFRNRCFLRCWTYLEKTRTNESQPHSVPPSSLDHRSTELIVSPKKVVGCRGRSRHVEGCWEFRNSQLVNVELLFCIFNLETYNYEFTSSHFYFCETLSVHLFNSQISNFEIVSFHIDMFIISENMNIGNLGHTPSNIFRISDYHIRK